MKISRLDRRDFIESMLLLGLSACAGPRAATRALGANPSGGAAGSLSGSPSGNRALGPLFRTLSDLADQLARDRRTAHEFARRAGAHLLELELEDDVLADWARQGPDDPGIGRNGTRVLHRRRLGRGGPGELLAVLFYTPAGVTNPPHEHHNLISIKRVLKGSYHVRQYERLRRVEPGVIAIRQVSELADVTFDGPCIDMTDDRLNAHWFGAVGSEPVLALNIVAVAPLAPSETFHGAGETRPPGQYYIDPTGVPDGDGVIRARSISREQAEEFARRPLASFPSRIARSREDQP